MGLLGFELDYLLQYYRTLYPTGSSESIGDFTVSLIEVFRLMERHHGKESARSVRMGN